MLSVSSSLDIYYYIMSDESLRQIGERSGVMRLLDGMTFDEKFHILYHKYIFI